LFGYDGRGESFLTASAELIDERVVGLHSAEFATPRHRFEHRNCHTNGPDSDKIGGPAAIYGPKTTTSSPKLSKNLARGKI
jgi:hypothetical protein